VEQRYALRRFPEVEAEVSEQLDVSGVARGRNVAVGKNMYGKKPIIASITP
jgi:hypothetical protein